MKPEHVFPVLLMVLNVGAAAGYLLVKNRWMAAYWCLAFGLNFIVTFKPNRKEEPMPGFKSLAQMRRCETLVAEGKMTQEAFDKAKAETNFDGLPERLHPKKERPVDPEEGGAE
ncbi:MAG TPA: hypothetical protein VFT43_07320 [Candidatus Polarisedimenticolia bacterium]|nr:hypothetical protein [Candidatus Polarisedimenticolia bacterium]